MAVVNIKAEAPLPVTMGELIKLYREKEKFTQQQLAKLVGISVGTVVNYEKDRTVPDVETLIMIIRVLRIPPEYVFSMVTNILDLYCPDGEFKIDDNGKALCEEVYEIESNIFSIYGCRKCDYSCLKMNDKVFLLYNDHMEPQPGNKLLVRFLEQDHFVIAEYDGQFYTNIFTNEVTDSIASTASRVLGEIKEYTLV